MGAFRPIGELLKSSGPGVGLVEKESVIVLRVDVRTEHLLQRAEVDAAEEAELVELAVEAKGDLHGVPVNPLALALEQREPMGDLHVVVHEDAAVHQTSSYAVASEVV